MKRLLLMAVIVFLVIIFFNATVDAYSRAVHEEITRRVINQNLQSLNIYVRNIGLVNGMIEEINGKKISDWMIEGSWMEDIGLVDMLTSHFYDPLTNKGYSVLGVEVGQSAYDSANDLSNYGAWVWARKRLYDGLTQTDKETREQYLGIVFQALGRAMHLVQDVAVPAHTRNDGHMPLVDNEPYEDYTNKHYNDFDYTSVPFPYWNVSISSHAPKQFWDLDSYDGSTVYASGYIGLAEYTNPNFFSKDTIFKDYPHPSFADTNYPNIDWRHPEIVDAGDGRFDNRIYITKTVGEPIKHLAAVSYVSYDVIKKGYYQYSPFVLDDACHNEYAQKLLPRAVGYSAGLLNYFFRGTLEITPPAQNVYGITDGSQTPYTDVYGNQQQQFTTIKAKVRNTTPNETIGAGSLTAVAKYRKRTDYKWDLSADPTEEHLEWGSYEPDYSYSVSAPRTLTPDEITAINAGPVEFAFDFIASPIPAGITDLYLQVVFKGTLGNEVDNAIAVGFKDLAEPAHHVFWNLSDMFSLGSEITGPTMYYHLYTAATISNTETLRNMVDLMPPGQPNGILNEQGEPYISPYPMTFEIAYINQSPPETPPLSVAKVVNLPAGRYIRLVMVQDRQQPRMVRFSYSDQIDPGVVDFSDQQFPEVINQTEPDGHFYYMPVETFRHDSAGEPIRHHFYTGILRCYPMPSEGYCPYKESESDPVELEPYEMEILFNNQ